MTAVTRELNPGTVQEEFIPLTTDNNDFKPLVSSITDAQELNQRLVQPIVRLERLVQRNSLP